MVRFKSNVLSLNETTPPKYLMYFSREIVYDICQAFTDDKRCAMHWSSCDVLNKFTSS